MGLQRSKTYTREHSCDVRQKRHLTQASRRTCVADIAYQRVAHAAKIPESIIQYNSNMMYLHQLHPAKQHPRGNRIRRCRRHRKYRRITNAYITHYGESSVKHSTKRSEAKRTTTIIKVAVRTCYTAFTLINIDIRKWSLSNTIYDYRLVEHVVD